MVRSVLNSEIEYEEKRTVDKSDVGHDATQFELELFPNIGGVVALGNVKYTYSDKNLLYVPVYLVIDGKVQDQIGVYEFLASNYTEILDEDNDIDIDLLMNPLPLYYKFFTMPFMKKKLGTSLINLTTGTPQQPADSVSLVTDLEAELEKEMDEEVESDKWTSPNKPTVLDSILGSKGDEESKESGEVKQLNQEMREREAYKARQSDSWIKKFMKNSSYSLKNNEAGGDCLFAVIRDGFRDIPRDMSVAQMRDIVSKAADESTLKNFREHYDMYNTGLGKMIADQMEIRDKIQVLKVRFSTAASRTDKHAISKEANVLSDNFKRLGREKGHARELIAEFKWLEGVDTLKKLKSKLKTCDFWAESWAINILERALGIKMIIFNSDNYKRGDIGNILQCGDMVDNDIIKVGSFNPKHYIIVSYSGDHYQLVKYNDKGIFTFNTIPPSIKRMIIDKCLESGEKGIYNMIPDFKALKSGTDKSKHLDRLPVTDSGAEDIDLASKEKSDEGYKKMKQVKYNPNIVFQFYSKSSGKPKPGKGAGEKINKKDILEFAELASIQDWRKVLSNFYKTAVPFDLDGEKWSSVEAFYQASKFKKNNPEFYRQFAMDGPFAEPGVAKAAGGKTGKYKGKAIRPKGINMDEYFFSSGENERSMFRAQMAKYKSDSLAKSVLMATKNAKLQHFLRGAAPIVFYDTMKIRSILENEK